MSTLVTVCLEWESHFDIKTLESLPENTLRVLALEAQDCTISFTDTKEITEEEPEFDENDAFSIFYYIVSNRTDSGGVSANRKDLLEATEKKLLDMLITKYSLNNVEVYLDHRDQVLKQGPDQDAIDIMLDVEYLLQTMSFRLNR